MEPDRTPESSVSALVDTLLTKGVYLDVDAIVTVAEIPLIGVSLRAALAGMETILEYGMMRDWDEATRAGAARSVAADDGGARRLSAARPGPVHPGPVHPGPIHPGHEQADPEKPGLEGEALFLEARSSGDVWRRGEARWDPVAGFTWRGAGDRRPAVRIAPAELVGVCELAGVQRAEPAQGLAGRCVLALVTDSWEAVIAVDRCEEWEAVLRRDGGAA